MARTKLTLSQVILRVKLRYALKIISRNMLRFTVLMYLSILLFFQCEETPTIFQHKANSKEVIIDVEQRLRNTYITCWPLFSLALKIFKGCLWPWYFNFMHPQSHGILCKTNVFASFSKNLYITNRIITATLLNYAPFAFYTL